MVLVYFTDKHVYRYTDTDTDTDTLLKTYATNVRKYHSTMTVTDKSSTIQHYNVKRHQLTNECLKTLKLHCGKTY